MKTIFSNNFIPQNLSPTRITSHSATLIDHTLVNHMSTVRSKGTWQSGISDDFTGFITVCSEVTIKTTKFPFNIVRKVKDVNLIFLMLLAHIIGIMSCK